MKNISKIPVQTPSSTGGVATTFWIQSENLRQLKEFAAKHDLSVSNVINRAIRRFLADPNPFFSSSSHTYHTTKKA